MVLFVVLATDAAEFLVHHFRDEIIHLETILKDSQVLFDFVNVGLLLRYEFLVLLRALLNLVEEQVSGDVEVALEILGALNEQLH